MSLPLLTETASGLLLAVALLGGALLGLLAWWRPPRRALEVALAGAPLPGITLWLLARVGELGPQAGQVALGSLSLAWRLDALAGLLLLLTQLVLLGSAAYAARYREAAALPATAVRFWPLLGGLALALGSLWVAADLLSLYAALELMGLCAVGMMLLPGSVSALAAGMRYLLYALVGSLAWLLGVALLLGQWGELALSELAIRVEPDPLTAAALGLLATGLLLKAAIFPLHTWLAPVHASAWTPVSAIHAALVVKASFFILLQLWRLLMPEALVGAWLLGMLGSLAVLWGGLLAWRTASLKALIAYSTLGQLGYLMLAFPLLAAGGSVAELAWQATWLQLAGHALAKAAMFMAAGNLILASGESRLADLAGSSRQLPLALMTFGLCAVTLMGLPPSAGFTAKWLLLQASLEADQWWWALVLVLGTLLTAAYLFRVFRYTFVETAPRHTYRALPPSLDLVALLLALAALGLGLIAEWPMALLRQGGVP